MDAIRGDHGPRRSRARGRARKTIPDGVYEAGVVHGRRRHRHRQARADPRQGHRQGRGDDHRPDRRVASRCAASTTPAITTGYACAQVAYKCLTSPTDYPINDGSFRSLKVIIPPGRVVSATRPAPMRWWMTFPMTIVDTIFKALQPAIPDRVIAGHHADLRGAARSTASIRRPRSSSSATSVRSAAAGAPSRPRTACRRRSASTTATPTTAPNEQAEAKFPIVVERYRAGRRIPAAPAAIAAGSASRARCARSTSITVNTQSDRAHCRPWGLDGGGEAHRQPHGAAARRPMEDDFPNAKVLVAQLKPGDAFRIRRAAAAAMARRSSGQSRMCARTCARATCRCRRRPRNMASWSIRRRSRSIGRRRKNGARRRGSAFSLFR